MLSQRSFSREFKLALCQEIVGGRLSKAKACAEHGLSSGMLDRWVGQYRQRGADSFPLSGEPASSRGSSPDRRILEMEALIGRQALEIEFLKAALKKGRELREKGRP